MGFFSNLFGGKPASVEAVVTPEKKIEPVQAFELETQLFDKLNPEVGPEAQMTLTCLARMTQYFQESGRVAVHTHQE